MTARRVRLGIVGCGHAGANLHLPALRHVEEIEVVAVCDTDSARAVSAARQLGVEARADVGALLDLELDAVGVCVPPVDHRAVAGAVLASGRHLLLEKPPTLSVADALALAAEAARAGVVAVAGFNLRHHRTVAAARGVLDSGSLGTIEAVRSTFTSGIRSAAGLPAWRHPGELSGAAIVDVGIHHLDLWRHLLGAEIDELTSVPTSRQPAQTTVVAGRMSNGCVVAGVFSQVGAEQNELEIVGREARLRVSMYRFDGLELAVTPALPGSARSRVAGGIASLRAFPGGVGAARAGGVIMESYARQWRQFARCVLDGEQPVCTLEDGAATLRAALSAAASMR